MNNSLKFTTGTTDYMYALKASRKHFDSLAYSLLYSALVISPIFAIVVLLPELRRAYNSDWILVYSACYLLMIGVVPTLRQSAIRRTSARLFAETMPQDVLIELGDDGLTVKTANSETRYRWTAFKEIQDKDTHLLLWLRGGNVIPIPKKDLPVDSLRDAVAEIAQHIEQPTQL